MSRLKQSTFLALAFLMVAGAFVRVYGLGVWDYFFDETWHLYVARQPTLAAVFHADLVADGHPILPYFLWHYALMLWNDPWMARLPSIIAGILCIPAGYLLGSEMLRTRGGAFFCAFFMTFSGIVIEQSDVVRGYIFMLLFTLMGLWSAFRYHQHPLMRYLAAYGVFMGLALLCEYVATPVIVFTAIYLLCSIYKKLGARVWPLICWSSIHAVLLAYLLGMMYLLRHIGGLNFSQGGFSILEHAQTGLKSVKLYLSYFSDVINDANFLVWISGAADSIDFFVISFVVFFCIAAAGFIWLRHARRDLLVLVMTLVVVSLGFFYFDIVPINSSRRNIDLIIGVMVAFYGGLVYLTRHGTQYKNWRLSPITVTLVATVILCGGYAIYGQKWRVLRPNEFQQTRKDSKDFFAFLNAHVGKNDIIVTDKLSYYYFWNLEHEHCTADAKAVSATVAYYSCYRVPIFFIRNEMRTVSVPFTLSDFQLALQDLDQLHRLADVKYVWIVGLQHVSEKTNLVSLKFARNVSRFLTRSEKKRYHQEYEQLITEQASFARYAYKNAHFHKIAYAYCPATNADGHFNGKDDCWMKFLALALPKAELETKVIHHAPFYSSDALLGEVKQARQHNQIF